MYTCTRIHDSRCVAKAHEPDRRSNLRVALGHMAIDGQFSGVLSRVTQCLRGLQQPSESDAVLHLHQHEQRIAQRLAKQEQAMKDLQEHFTAALTSQAAQILQLRDDIHRLAEAQQQHATAAAHAGYSRPQPALPRPALSSSKVMADRAQDFAMNQNMVTSASRCEESTGAEVARTESYHGLGQRGGAVMAIADGSGLGNGGCDGGDGGGSAGDSEQGGDGHQQPGRFPLRSPPPPHALPSYSCVPCAGSPPAQLAPTRADAELPIAAQLAFAALLAPAPELSPPGSPNGDSGRPTLAPSPAMSLRASPLKPPPASRAARAEHIARLDPWSRRDRDRDPWSLREGKSAAMAQSPRDKIRTGHSLPQRQGEDDVSAQTSPVGLASTFDASSSAIDQSPDSPLGSMRTEVDALALALEDAQRARWAADPERAVQLRQYYQSTGARVGATAGATDGADGAYWQARTPETVSLPPPPWLAAGGVAEDGKASVASSSRPARRMDDPGAHKSRASAKGHRPSAPQPVWPEGGSSGGADPRGAGPGGGEGNWTLFGRPADQAGSGGDSDAEADSSSLSKGISCSIGDGKLATPAVKASSPAHGAKLAAAAEAHSSSTITITSTTIPPITSGSASSRAERIAQLEAELRAQKVAQGAPANNKTVDSGDTKVGLHSSVEKDC